MKKSRLYSGIGALLAFLLCLPAGRTIAYMTDSAQKTNPMTPGNNVTRIVEEFPPVSPQDPEDDPVIRKVVRVTAPSGSGTNVDCYVRARILFSNSDIGDAVTLSGMDPAWVRDGDGYYYYTPRLREGETTAPLFTTVSIDSSKLNERSKAYISDFSITVYEESVQAGDSKISAAAWAQFRH